ncbi:MAG: dihydroorotase [Prevotella sp.]|nr:dihydroorotase [Prevotella sp.]
METLIKGGTIINEGNSFEGYLVVKDDRLDIIHEGNDYPQRNYDEVIDASGCFIFPGIIDCHVHFREPGLTEKADIEHESRAAAYGGITSYFDMPNTVPQTICLEALNDKFTRAKHSSYVNYSFFFGATNDNIADFQHLDRHRIPGIKLFMGASTGNMKVDEISALMNIFQTAHTLQLPLMVHCEDNEIINRNMKEAVEKYGEDPMVQLHPKIRSEEACVASSSLAVGLAQMFDTQLHVAHVSTEAELGLFGRLANITAEAVIAHLFFSDDDYSSKGALIKCNPAIKTDKDRDALRKALNTGIISTVGTDHAPHLLTQKQGGCKKAASGMPMIQFSLPVMLELVDENILPIERIPTLMAHNPARIFNVNERGYLREGYKADITIVRPHCPWTVTEDIIQSKCKWSPLMGHTFNWRVERTICNGTTVYHQGMFNEHYRGEEINFR